jgi:hypothetical protein
LSTRGWTVSEMWLGMSAAFAPLAKPKVRPHVIIHTAYRSPGVRQDPEKLRRWQRAGCFLPECTDRILGLGGVSQLSKASAGKQPQKHMQKDGGCGEWANRFLGEKTCVCRAAWFLGTAKLGSSLLHFSPLRRPDGSFSIRITFRCCLPLI